MEKQYDNLEYYNKNAKLYFEQTKVGNLEENYEKFLSRIEKGAYILDFGCGSGRDSKFFLEKGYKVKAIDGSIEMCKIAADYINQDVECMLFEDLKDKNTYDAIWACSSILHVEKEKLPNIIIKMINALKPNGIIYTSFKKGSGYEIKEGKYYNYTTKEEFEEMLNKLNINAKIVDYFETLPSTNRPGAESTIWSNYIIRR